MKNERMSEIPIAQGARQFMINTLTDATSRLINLTDEERAGLKENFWPSHAAILEKYEYTQPGITEQVFLLFEQLGAEELEAAQEYFEKVTLPQAKRRAFINGMLGRQVTLPWKSADRE